MGDEQVPKRRKRAPMFYKVKYLQERTTTEEIPRETVRRRNAAATLISTHSTPNQDPEVPSAESHQKGDKFGSNQSLIREMPPLPLQPVINQEQDRNECRSHQGLSGEGPSTSSSVTKISYSVETPHKCSEQRVYTNERPPPLSPEDRFLATAAMSGGEVEHVTDDIYRGAGVRGGGGSGPSDGSSSLSDDSTDSSSDESSSDKSSSDESSSAFSNGDGTSSSEEEVCCNDDYFANARERANNLRRKYPLDDKITQSNDNGLSKMECLLLVLSFSVRHALDDVAVGDLLKLINDIMGREVIPDSLWVFNKIFHFDCGVDYHFYCLECEIYIGKYSDLRGEVYVDCPNQLCDKKCYTSKMNDGHFFVSLPLRPQLQSFLENTPDINDLLNYRFSREDSENTIRDIFDGEWYRKLSQEGEILSDSSNFSLSFNTDGAPIFLSVNNSMWPIQCRINELPPKIRFKSANMFICGIWFGSKSHPNMNVFNKFCKEARSLYLQGLNWKQPSGDVAHSKVVTLQCILDSVAKPDVQCMKQFNAYHGCGYCYHPGDLVDLEKDEVIPRQPINVEVDGNNIADNVEDDDVQTVGNTNDRGVVNEDVNRSRKKVVKQVRYTFSQGGPYTERLDSEIREDMISSATENQSVRGVKGISPLIVLLSFNLVYGFGIDAMHAVFLGVTTQLLKLWTDSKYGTAPFSVRKYRKDCIYSDPLSFF